MSQNGYYSNSLYRPDFEHDACGVGFIADIKGKRSNTVVRHGIRAVCNLAHRGAVDADAKTGDGVGVLTQIPYKLFTPIVERRGHKLFQESDLGVGMVFLPHDNAYAQARAKAIIEEVIKKRGLFLFGWREVPINVRVLGDKAQSTMPRIEQVLIGRPWGMTDADYERRLYLARKEIEKVAAEDRIQHFYIASFSHRMVAYKGLLTSPSLEKFYKDLTDPNYESALCIYHQRYSTNTFPRWPICQPFRMMAHNGEINTRRGNVNWMKARESELESPVWGQDIEMLKPVIQSEGSDSSEFDNALEALVMSGRDVLHAMTMMVPPAWRNDKFITPDLAAFYNFHRCFTEPWDGPAALVFSDGITVAASLDRNGLRPARYKLTEDGIFSLGSEVGNIEIDDAKTIEKGRIGPGEMIAINTAEGRLLRDHEIKAQLAARRPYKKWIEENAIFMTPEAVGDPVSPEGDLDILTLTQRQMAFGYTSEELEMVLKPMVKSGEEATGSMGDDTPLAILSLQPRLLYTYFQQLFAQVTNPPIDPLREELVMSLSTVLGWRRNLLQETPEHARQVISDTPVLFDHELEWLKELDQVDHKSATISVLWPVSEGAAGFEKAIDRICAEASALVDQGVRILILSDRGVDHANIAAPMLAATGAVHHHLKKAGKRMRLSIVCETGEARDVHQIACLIGYGAAAVNPYLAFETCRELIEFQNKGLDGVNYQTALKNYRKAIEKGLRKIMSKMGISVLGSYLGAQIFETVGFADSFIEKCFRGTPSPLQGIGFKEIADETLTRHARGFATPIPEEKSKFVLDDLGYYRYRRTGEMHSITPPVIKNFHTFVRGNDPKDYAAYVAALREMTPTAPRHLLAFVPLASGPVPIEEVESIEDIRRRFTTAGMSLGALSPEMHECLAIAMNRIGGKSNSGEGGEDPVRFHRRPDGDLANSAIKQVAAGRFGVTAAYLASAKEIEIKMAQGAKPGEGGQLPGHKVTSIIAKLRKSVPGVTLISPPPHHDIYSIEDLAQLIYDLKAVNPRARVCVKLVAETGVGTVAAGVAKAHADVILISGHDGGTGASPLSSVKHAGSAWELGISEAHQVLMLNGLRNRVTLRTDGGLRTGEDIIYAAMLGAEEYNFGTTAMIAAGCVYVRQCHVNTCPVGVATQDEKLRAKFKGKPEHIVNFFNAVAQEVREFMAKLGVRTINELVGRVDMLRQKDVPGHVKANSMKLERMLFNPSLGDDSAIRHATRLRNDPLPDRTLDDVVLQDAQDAVNDKKPVSLSYRVKNTNRSVGTQLSGEIGYQYGEEGLPEGTIELNLTGSAGQSFGAFLSPGVRLILTGEGNDYVGKGTSGGEIIVKPLPNHLFKAQDNMIIGNTCLYGSTGGLLFANGRAGERFAVRNCGATAVVEGIGDHGCEYMTGGKIVVLGKAGKNFGAGMTGGIAYVLDMEEEFEHRYNTQLVQLERLAEEEEITSLKELIFKHLEKTESAYAKEILGDWPKFGAKFWKVVPKPLPKPADPAKKEPVQPVAPAVAGP